MSNIFNMSESRKRNQMCIAFSQTSDGMKNARRKRGTWTVILRSHGGYIKACSYGTAIIAGGYIAWASVHKEQHDSPRHLGIAGQLKAVCTLSETLHPSRRRFFLRIGNFCGHFHHGRQYCKGRKSGSTAVSIRYPAQCAFGNSTYNLSS